MIILPFVKESKHYAKINIFSILGLFYIFHTLVQRHKIKIRLIAVGFLVVELVDSHVGVLDFLGAVAEWVGNMGFGSHNDDHIRRKHCAVYSLDPFGPYFEYFTHNDLF